MIYSTAKIRQVFGTTKLLEQKVYCLKRGENKEGARITADPYQSTNKLKPIITDLQSVCDYVDEHGCIYWNHIIHYMTDFDSFPQTLVLLTPASMF